MTNEDFSGRPPPLYFANAAAGIMLPEVVEATIAHLRLEAEIGAVPAAGKVSAALAQGYAAAAELIGADMTEVGFVESGNRALAALIQSAALGPGDHVLVDRTCWGGTLQMLSSYPDVVIDVLPIDRYGRVDVVAARGKVHSATKLIVLTWCPATCGLFNPAAEVGVLAEEIGAFYIIDACQVVGQRPVNARDLRCHGLAASGRKWLRAPRGTALLYASQAYLDSTQPFMPDQFAQARTDARRYETGESNVAARVGLSAALRATAAGDMNLMAHQLAEIANVIRGRLSEFPAISVIEQGPDLASFVTLTGLDLRRIMAELERSGICVSNPGRAYTPLDMDARGSTSVIRIAPHLDTKSADIDALISAIERATAASGA